MNARIGPASAPLGFLSDIHGNLPALEAALHELGQQGVVDIFVAGDLLLGGDEPLAVYRRLKAVGARCVKGPTDVALATIDPATLRPQTDAEQARLDRFVQTRTAVGELVLRDLGHLPDTIRVPMIDGRELLVVHGSPLGMHETFTHDLSDEEVNALICDDPADIVVCGGSHVPFLRVVGEVEICNVGSVGEAPEGGHAHCTVVSPRVDGATITQHYASYRTATPRRPRGASDR